MSCFGPAPFEWRELSRVAALYDVITVGVVGFASVIALNLVWQGGQGFEARLLVMLTALLALAGVLQVVKSTESVSVQPIDAPSPSSTPRPTTRPTTASPGAAESPTAPSPPPTAGRDAHEDSPPTERFIDDLVPQPNNDPYDSVADAVMDGTTYPHSQGAQFCSSSLRTWSYDLDRRYRTLRAHVGLTGVPSAGTSVRFEVLVDGRARSTQDVRGAGRSVPIEVAVADGKLLQLVTSTRAAPQDCAALTAQWADVRLDPA